MQPLLLTLHCMALHSALSMELMCVMTGHVQRWCMQQLATFTQLQHRGTIMHGAGCMVMLQSAPVTLQVGSSWCCRLRNGKR
jgi:hypothetical protein